MFANWYAELNFFSLAAFTPVSAQTNSAGHMDCLPRLARFRKNWYRGTNFGNRDSLSCQKEKTVGSCRAKNGAAGGSPVLSQIQCCQDEAISWGSQTKTPIVTNVYLVKVFSWQWEVQGDQLWSGSMTVTSLSEKKRSWKLMHYTAINKIDPSCVVCGRLFPTPF